MGPTGCGGLDRGLAGREHFRPAAAERRAHTDLMWAYGMSCAALASREFMSVPPVSCPRLQPQGLEWGRASSSGEIGNTFSPILVT